METTSTSRRILVVDDNIDAAESLSMLLGFDGHETRVAGDGPAALEALKEGFAPDLVLLDIGLPGMDGYEVAQAIRSDAANARIRLVALTGWGQEEHRTRAREAGFDEHLVKPVDFEALGSVVARASRATPAG
jgi:two-component system CheB/CheR fusion protein